MSDGRIECHLTLRSDDFIMRNHRVHGVSVMPGVAFLDIVYRILIARGVDHRRAVLRNVLFTEAIAASGDADRRLRVVIGPCEDGVRTVVGESRPARGEPSGWTRNFAADLCEADDPEPALDVAMPKDGTSRRDVAELYARARTEHIEHGPPMRCRGRLFQGPDGLLAELALEDGDPAHEQNFHLHPAKLDAASLVAFGQRPAPQDPFIPIFIDYFRAPRPLHGPSYVHVPRPEVYASSGDIVRSDCRVFDAEGRLVAEFGRLSCKRIRRPDLITGLVAGPGPGAGPEPESPARPAAASAERPAERDAAAELSGRLRTMVAGRLGRDPASIGTATGFYDLGLDSVAMLGVTRDLEELFDTGLYPTLLFEFGDIDALAGYLAAEYGPPPTAEEAAPREPVKAGPAPADETAFFAAAWGPAPEADGADGADRDGDGDVVVFGGHPELSGALRSTLSGDGRRVVHVVFGDEVTALEDGTFRVPAGDRRAAAELLAMLAGRGIEPRTLVVAEPGTGTDAPYFVCWALAAGYVDRRPSEPCELLYLHTAPDGVADPRDTAVGALARVLSAEVAAVRCRRVEVRAEAGNARTLAAAARAALRAADVAGSAELLYRGGELMVRGYRPYTPEPGALPLRDEGVYVLAGGTGGIGALLADHLCRHHRARIALISTGPLGADLAGRIADWEDGGAQVLHLRADLADETQVAGALDAVRARYGRVDGVFHCAGRVRDAVLVTKTREDAADVLAPKVAGTLHLDRATAGDELDLFVVFSSISAALANPGQCDYAYANAFQEQFARVRAGRADRSGLTLAIGWPYWADGGMRVAPDAVARTRRETGLAPMPTGEAMRALLHAGAGPAVAVTAAYGDLDAVRRTMPPPPGGPSAWDASGPAVPAVPGRPAAPRAPDAGTGPIAIVGVAGQYPRAGDLRRFWENLADGHDCVTGVPSDRWDHDEIYHPERGTPGRTYGRWGGFLDGVDLFDHEFFGISRRDAERMDPQERLFLSVAWQTLEDAGHPPATLAGRAVGVFAGVMWNHYQLGGPGGDGVAPMAAHSAIANRVSHLLDVHGPSLALDTACSSSLTALQLAADALRRGDCELALAGGVNLIVHPQKYLQLAQGRFLSDDGRCRAFGRDGTGYVPGEGVGAVLLKPLDRARADGDHVYAIVRGSHLNHSGRTSGFTVPSPGAQTAVIQEALRRSAVDPRDIGYVEAHGTGTSLGDPIEEEGIRRAFTGVAPGSASIGSVKTNIGHLESAAGIAGLTKVLLQFHHRRLAPSLHADELNPHIDFASSPVRVQRVLEDWETPASGRPRMAAVSAFGAGGSNAHVILEAPPAPPVRDAVPGPHLFVLSAHGAQALRALASAHLEYLDGDDLPDIADLAHTSRTGRNPLRVRLAVVADDLDGVKTALRHYIEGRAAGVDEFWDAADGPEPTPAEIEALLAEGAAAALADAWVRGAEVDWRAAGPRLVPGRTMRRVPLLPPYPFQGERCWLGNWHQRREGVGDGPSEPAISPGQEPSEAPEAPEAAQASEAAQATEGRQVPDVSRESVVRAIEDALCAELYVDRSEIDPTTPLRDMGVDSITAEVVREDLSERFAVELDSVAVYDHPTVERLAELVLTLGPSGPPDPTAEAPVEPVEQVEQGTAAVRPEVKEPGPEAGPADIAVIGMAGRFPDAPDLDTFWENLAEGRSAVREVPPDRWDVDSCYHPDKTVPGKSCSRWAALLDDVDAFDAGFFGMSPLEAQATDPQQRLFLQEAWKALEDAGYAGSTPPRLGTCGVFVGSGAGDYGELLGREGLLDSGYGFLGTAPSILAARIAYRLDLSGPTLAVDTACSSSLVAIHLACQSIRSGESETALAGGVALMLTPRLQIRCSQVGMLSPTGRCVPFDAAADGTVLGEGVGAVVLKRLDRALADGDHVHGVIRASGVNGDGRTNGITAPSAAAQARLIADVHHRAGMDPGDIGYVEAHGTGTPLGDPIEVKALTQVFGNGTDRTGFCGLGSVKANIGHTTMAAGVASLIKVLLAIRHRTLPPAPGFTAPNPHIDLAEGSFRVPTEPGEWRPGPSGVRAATVSGFGFSGTNCHLVVAEAPPRPRASSTGTGTPVTERLAVPVSATSEPLLRRRLTDLADALDGVDGAYALRDVAYTLATGHRHLPVRAGIVAGTLEEFRERCRTLAAADRPAVGPSEPADTEPDGGAVRVAAAYVNGEDPDWERRYADAPVRRVPFPSSPFADDRHWAGERAAGPADTSPLLGAEHAPGLFDLDAAQADRLMRDHRIEGRPVFPATAVLETAVAALMRGGGTLPAKLASVRWTRPLTPWDHAARPVRLRLDAGGRFTISAGEGAGAPYAAGVVSSLPPESVDAVDLAAVEGRCTSYRDAADLYGVFRAAGMEYGPGLRVLSGVAYGADEALARLGAEACAPVPSGRVLDPALLDGALQAACVLFPDDGEPLVPFSVDTVEVYAPLNGAARAHVTRTAEHTFSIRVTDGDGAVLARLAGLVLRSPNGAPGAPMEPLLYLPGWREAQRTAVASPYSRGRTLIVHTPQDTDLAHAIRDLHDGEAVTLLPLTGGVAGRPEPGAAFEHVYFLARTSDAAPIAPDRLTLGLFELLKTLIDAPSPRDGRLTVVLDGAVAVDAAEPVRPYAAALLGLARTFGAEFPRWSVRCVDLGADPAGTEDSAARASAVRDAPDVRGETDADPLVAVRGARRLVRRPVAARPPVPADRPFRCGGRFLIAGGAGGIGQVLSRHLAATAGAHVIWVGRRPLDTEIAMRMDEVAALGGRASYVRADITDATALREAVAGIRAEHGPIHGAVHSAGVLSDRTLANLDEETFRTVLTPKIAGAVNLREALRGEPLDLLLFFSSAASFVDTPGQANYAAASTFLDAYALHLRNSGQVPATVVNWGYWGDVGMGAGDPNRRRFAELGVGSIGPAEGMAALERLLAAGTPQALVLKAGPTGLARFGVGTAPHGTAPDGTAPAEDLPGVSVSGAAASDDATALRARARGYVRKVFAEVLKYREANLGLRTTFDDFGVDSLISLNIIRRFERDLGDLPSTLLFEHLTIEQLADYFADEHRDRLAAVLAGEPSSVPPAATSRPRANPPDDARAPRHGDPGADHGPGDVAIVGVTGRYPGSPDLDAYWRNLAGGVDCVTEIPADRWDWRRFFDSRKGTPQRTYSRWGGFIEDVDLFDPGFFGILPRDAVSIDPQERLFLETAWNLLEETGHLGEYTREPETGVFVGIMYGGYGELGATQWPHGRLSGANSAYWSVANRVSYTFDFTGPSFAVDSACSSSLTALHLAAESLRRGECRMAIAGGVNLILHPNHHVSLSASAMLSADGACKPFDSRADGYVPGEGVGAVLLKPLHRAVADGDRVWAVLRGSAVNAGGRTSGFTVPNPGAQSALIASALERAGVPPATVGYLEAHGTGTELGDPIEVAALTRAFGGPAAPPAVIGSVKANIGHLEAAAGIAGLTRVLLQLRHRRIAPGIHLDETNPKIDFGRSPFRPVREAVEWDAPGEHPRRAGISSFGAGGANAHVLVEEYAEPAAHRFRSDDGDEHLFVLSAPEAGPLRELAARVGEYVADERACEATVRELAYTSQVGRREMAERVAVVASGRAELAAGLLAFARGEDHPGVAAGTAGDGSADGLSDGDDGTGATAALAARRDLAGLGRAWVLGAPVDWRDLWSVGRPGRARFPTSVFRRRRYWLPLDGPTMPGEPPAGRQGRPAVGQDAQLEPVPSTAPEGAAVDRAPGGESASAGPRFLRPVWRPAPPESTADGERRPRSALVLTADETLAAELADRLNARGVRCEVATLATADDPVRARRLIDGLIARDTGPELIVYALPGGPAAGEDPVGGFHAVFWTAAAVLDHDGRAPLRIAVAHPGGDGDSRPGHAALSGMLRTLELEHGGCTGVRIEHAPGTPAARLAEIIVAEALDGGASGRTVRHGEGGRTIRSLEPFTPDGSPDPARLPLRPGGTYLITGGAGGLGLRFAGFLAEHGPLTLVLTGRSEPDERTRAAIEALARPGVRVHYLPADVSDRAATGRLLARIRQEHGDLHGIVHAAGVTRDSRAVRKTPDEVADVLAPKVHGVLNLDESTVGDPLDFFVLFSSATAQMGNPGQGDYGYANAFLDEFAHAREVARAAERRRGRTVSIGWPLWRDGGMTVDDATVRLMARRWGIAPLSTGSGLRAFCLALTGSADGFVVFDPSGTAPAPEPEREPGTEPEADRAARVENDLRELTAGFLLVDREEVDTRADLMELGFDSVSLTELINRVNDLYALDLLPTVLFEYPTLSDLAAYLDEHHRPRTADRTEAPIVPAPPTPAPGTPPVPGPSAERHGPAARERTEIAIVGMAGILPGAPDIGTFWRRLAAGDDLVGPVPPDRADLLSDPRSRDVRGGFIDDPALFDAALFGISPREAALMDPQQRLFLQVVWRALEDAGHRPSSLAGSATGLFAGVATSDYDAVMARNGVPAEAHMATGVAHAILANRVSYLLDLRGPSEAVDTACSSALVALHRAVRAIEAGECDAAIAGGVNITLSPGVFAAFGQAGMLSPDGRCKTFDAAADGYVRGEGAGAVLLKPLGRALTDGDHIYAVVKGSAVNHGGRTASLTAPTPRAQADVVTRAHREADIDPATVGYIEAHGTGTRLGDPIEIEALKEAFARLLDERGSPSPAEPVTGIGSAKTNIGHLEAAAGIAGVLKVLLAMEHGELPAMLHLREPNPYLRLDGSPFYLVDHHRPWPPVRAADDREVRRAGVSSFGFGGTNAHVVLEQPPVPQDPRVRSDAGARPEIFVLSAPSQEALSEYADVLADHLAEHPDIEPVGVAHTLRVGREEWRERLAIVAAGVEELVEKLRTAAAGRPAAGLHRATAARDGSPWEGRADGSAEALDDLARAWVNGAAVDWTRCRPGPRPRRLRLPGPPFSQTRHWFTGTKPDPTTGPTTETAVATSDRPVRRADPPARPRRPQVKLAPTNAATAPAPARTVRPAVAVPPAETGHASEPVDEVIRVRLSEILAVPAAEIEEDRPFAELGLDSIFRMDLARLLNASYGLELEAAELYEHDTVGGLARFVRRTIATRAEAVQPDAVQPDAAGSDAAGSEAVGANLGRADARQAALAEAAPVGSGVRDDDGDAERALCELIEAVLGRPLSPGREFAEAELTSFDMLRVVSELERWLGGLRKTLLFDHPTLEKLTGYLCSEYGHAAVAGLRAEPGTAVLEAATAPDGAGPLIVRRRETAARPALRELVDELERRYAKESGLAGRDIAPLAFLGSTREGFFTFSRRGDDLFCWSYVGPDEHFTELAGEYLEYARSNGLKASFLSLKPLAEAGGQRLTSTPFGAVQRLEDLGAFTLEGGAMSRLRYMVRRFQRAGECRTVEYRSGDDPGTDRRLVELIDRWADGKPMTNPYVRTVRAEIARGGLPERHRIFLTYVDGALVNAVVITRVPSEDGYLLDVEFYPADMPLGGLEYAIVQIVSALRDEGHAMFTFGASFGVRAGDSGNADPEVEEGLEQLRSVGVFGTGNFQFKNKFRPVNHPLYLCRPADGSRTGVADIILMIADPAVVAAEESPAPSDPPTSPNPPAPPASGRGDGRGEREALLARYGHNPVLIPHDRVEHDLLTDSWAERLDVAMGDRVRALTGQAFSGPAGAFPSWLPFDTAVPTVSGRAAEALLCRSWPGRRGLVAHNGLFPSWLFALADNGFDALEVDRTRVGDFAGDLDADALDRALAEHPGGMSFVVVELTCNAAGGMPVSLAGLRRVAESAGRHGIPLVLDATRVVENAMSVLEHEPGQRGRGLWEVVHDLLAQADAVTVSATKDFGVTAGGLAATRLPGPAERMREQAESRVPGPGLLERTMLAHALEDRDGVAELVGRRREAVRTLWQRLAEAGAPLAGERPGGHCVLLDVSRWPAAAGLRHPVPSFLAWMFRHTGVRGGPHLAGAGLVRLAVPVGTGDVESVADRLARLFASPPEPVDLIAARDDPEGTAPDPRAVYHPADQVPEDLREVLAEGHRPADENGRALREAAPDVRRHLIAVPGGEVEAYSAGDGPALLLMHPFNMGAAAFARQFRDLADRYRVVVIHHPGVGATTADEDITLNGISDLQLRAMQELGLGGPVHVAGASFGSLLAQNFVLRYPDRALSLSLICGSFRYANRTGGVNRLELVVAEDLDRIIAETSAPGIVAERDRLLAELLRAESMDPRTGLRYLDLFAGEPDLRADLPHITVPTQIIQGRHDTVIPLKTAHLLHGLIPDASYAELPEAGHFPCVTHPDEVNELLAGFLARVTEPGGGE